MMNRFFTMGGAGGGTGWDDGVGTAVASICGSGTRGITKGFFTPSGNDAGGTFGAESGTDTTRGGGGAGFAVSKICVPTLGKTMRVSGTGTEGTPPSDCGVQHPSIFGSGTIGMRRGFLTSLGIDGAAGDTGTDSAGSAIGSIVFITRGNGTIGITSGGRSTSTRGGAYGTDSAGSVPVGTGGTGRTATSVTALGYYCTPRVLCTPSPQATSRGG